MSSEVKGKRQWQKSANTRLFSPWSRTDALRTLKAKHAQGDAHTHISHCLHLFQAHLMSQSVILCVKQSDLQNLFSVAVVVVVAGTSVGVDRSSHDSQCLHPFHVHFVDHGLVSPRHDSTQNLFSVGW